MEFMELLSSPQAWISFGTLFALELVLGVDNVIFISILSGKLPADQQNKARITGLALAVITRIILLMSISWIVSLTEPLFSVFGQEFTGRSIILLTGGMFLIAKSTFEIHDKLEGDHNPNTGKKISAQFAKVIFQILLLDIVFSLDSVITAIGMVNQISIMVAAVLASTLVMIMSARSISNFVDRHPTVKMLALSFLLMIGFTLVVESFEYHVPKGYIYFAMGFSLFVEFLNLRLKIKKPV